MAEISFRELIDPRRLQHLQNEFCKVTGVAAVCLDNENQVLTEPYVDKTWKRPDGEDPISTEYRRKAAQALDRVQAGSLEEQVVEELPDGGHVAAVAVSVENNTILYWQVYDLKKIDTISFYQILDLLRDTSVDIYRDRMSCFSAEAESRRSRSAEEEMSRNLHTIEATTEIVQLLDSDEQIELAMNKWLKILSEHIRVDTADIFQLHSDTDTMNVVCEWRAPGQISYFDKINGVEVYSFLHAEKPLVVSTDSLGNAGSKEIEEIGMKAVMIFPILKQESGNMVLSLNHRTQGHVWSMAEIKFTADAVKILQSILTRRIQKNSLAGSYAALEEILDNVGCAIYVTDQTTGRMLFANQILKNTFAKELLDHNFDALLQSSVPYSFCLTREPGVLSASHPAPLPSPENLPPDTGDSEKLIFKAVLSLGSTRSSSSAGISQESHVRHSPPALCMLFPLLIPMHSSLPGSSGCNSPQISPEIQFWTAYRDFCQGTPA